MKLLFITMVLVIGACSHTPKAVDNNSIGEPPPTSAASIEAKQLAAEQEANAVVEINFKKGSTSLSSEAQLKISKVLGDIGKDQKVSEIKVISWSDEEYPSADQKPLSDKQIQLAKNRNQEIQKFLINHNKNFKVETMSMAERPGKLAQLWGGTDARLKKSLEDAGIPTTGESLKGPSKASQSIVMLQIKRID